MEKKIILTESELDSYLNMAYRCGQQNNTVPLNTLKKELEGEKE